MIRETNQKQGHYGEFFILLNISENSCEMKYISDIFYYKLVLCTNVNIEKVFYRGFEYTVDNSTS
jgi:hypothetical protein